MATSIIKKNIRKVTTSGTTGNNGEIAGSISNLVPGARAGDILLAVYFETEQISTRHIDIFNYGYSGYSLIFYENGSVVSNSNVSYTAVYLSVGGVTRNPLFYAFPFERRCAA